MDTAAADPRTACWTLNKHKRTGLCPTGACSVCASATGWWQTDSPTGKVSSASVFVQADRPTGGKGSTSGIKRAAFVQSDLLCLTPFCPTTDTHTASALCAFTVCFRHNATVSCSCLIIFCCKRTKCIEAPASLGGWVKLSWQTTHKPQSFRKISSVAGDDSNKGVEDVASFPNYKGEKVFFCQASNNFLLISFSLIIHLHIFPQLTPPPNVVL